jgi:RimJ/RimL family protein N-acetyltransferase
MIILETERLIFRPHEPADFEPFCAMEADLEVRRYVGGAPRTREAAEQRFWNRPFDPPFDKLSMWATVLKSEGAYIGRCGIYSHIVDDGPVPGEAALGFYLARPYWGRGLATEAATAFVAYCFGELNLTRIVTAVQTGNLASAHILHKIGFIISRHEPGVRSFDHFELLSPAHQQESK